MIVTADLHLGKTADSYQKGALPSQTEDTLACLYELYAHAVDTKQEIVIAGDIFTNTHPNPDVIAAFLKWLSRCVEGGVGVHMIPGNHDADVRWNTLHIPSSAGIQHTHLRPAVTEVEGVPVLFVPHSSSPIPYGALSKDLRLGKIDPAIGAVIGHGMVDSNAMTEYDNEIFYEAGRAMVYDPNEIPGHAFLILGHVHTHMSANNEKVIVPGSPTCTNFGEVEDIKGYLEVDLKNRSWQFNQFQSASVTPWVQVDIDLVSKDKIDMDEEVIHSLVEGAVVKLVIRARDPLQVDEVAIKRVFNRYGKVTRCETTIEKTKRIDKSRLKIDMDHEALLIAYLNEQGKERKAVCDKALEIGKEIIAEVRHD